MEAGSIPGPSCPICGHSAFAWETSDDLLIEIGDARYRPRVCADCGNLQLVLTRAETPEPSLVSA